MNDVNIADSEWNRYLKKYKDKYLLKRNEEGIWCIRCKKIKGFVMPYSIVNEELALVVDFRSKQAKTWFLKKLDKNATNSFRISQEGDCDISIVFNEKDVSRLQKSLYLRQKRKISAKERLRLTENLRKAREMRKLDVIKNE